MMNGGSEDATRRRPHSSGARRHALCNEKAVGPTIVRNTCRAAGAADHAKTFNITTSQPKAAPRSRTPRHHPLRRGRPRYADIARALPLLEKFVRLPQS
jgi:hypothetical protein